MKPTKQDLMILVFVDTIKYRDRLVDEDFIRALCSMIATIQCENESMDLFEFSRNLLACYETQYLDGKVGMK